MNNNGSLMIEKNNSVVSATKFKLASAWSFRAVVPDCRKGFNVTTSEFIKSHYIVEF